MPHPRTALVTGGSRGIGHRVCRELTRQGTFVIVHAPAQAEAHAAADREFGQLDLLVNNAGALALPGPTGDGIDATC